MDIIRAICRAKTIVLALIVYINLSVNISYGQSANGLLGHNKALSVGSISIFDGTLYSNKPEFFRYCIQGIKIIYHNDLWLKTDGDNRIPVRLRILGAGINTPANSSAYAVLDIEHWPLFDNRKKVLQENLKRHLELIREFKKYRAGTRFGFYDLPGIDLRRTTPSRTKQERPLWQIENDGLKDLFAEVDALFPALYTIYTDEKRWVNFATEKLIEARRLSQGKPVYALLWPQYHGLNLLRKYEFIDPGFWRRQLELVAKYADGIIVWGGWDDTRHKPAEWDDKAEWWSIIKNFIRKHSTEIVNSKGGKCEIQELR